MKEVDLLHCEYKVRGIGAAKFVRGEERGKQNRKPKGLAREWTQ